MTKYWISVLGHGLIVVFYVKVMIQESVTDQTPHYLLERPQVDYVNPNYIYNISFILRRYNRTDAYHYVNWSTVLLKKLDTTCKIYLYFYEYISHAYKRSVLELEYLTCDWIDNDDFLGAVMRDAYKKIPKSEKPMAELKCPIMPGTYIFRNILVPVNTIAMFEFPESSLYINLTCHNKLVASGHLNFKIEKKRKAA